MFEPWEDIRLADLVQIHGTTNWHIIANYLPGRNAHQCRERWSNYVNPNLLKHEWTESEDEILLTTYRDIGPKWFIIANFLPGRSRNSVKNRYFALQRNATLNIKNQSECPFTPIMPILQDFSTASVLQTMSNVPIQQQMQFEQIQISEEHQMPIMTEESKQHVNDPQELIELSNIFDDNLLMDWDIEYIDDPFFNYF
jgi:hypothetical protein